MSDEARWVAWIPTGKEGTDKGAVVGPEWLVRKQAMAWLQADPEFIGRVLLAPVGEVVTAEWQRVEPIVVFSNDEEF